MESNFDTARAFSALGDQTRLSLLVTLSEHQALSITELAAKFAVSRQAVTKHLRILENQQLVRSRRIGRVTQFTIEANRLLELRTYLEVMAKQWDQALVRLKAHAET